MFLIILIGVYLQCVKPLVTIIVNVYEESQNDKKRYRCLSNSTEAQTQTHLYDSIKVVVPDAKMTANNRPRATPQTRWTPQCPKRPPFPRSWNFPWRGARWTRVRSRQSPYHRKSPGIDGAQKHVFNLGCSDRRSKSRKCGSSSCETELSKRTLRSGWNVKVAGVAVSEG